MTLQGSFKGVPMSASNIMNKRNKDQRGYAAGQNVKSVHGAMQE